MVEAYPVSDHCDGKRFRNLAGVKAKGVGAASKWALNRQKVQWPKHVENPSYPLPSRPAPGQVTVTFINHSTFLLQSNELAILTDPLYAERASPVSFAGPRRVRKPGIAFGDLPKIDLVLVSHNHYDHMDLPTLKRLAKRDQPRFVTTLGNRKLLGQQADELDWWQTWTQPGISITCTPAQHFSARTPFDRNRTLWGGFMIEFAGKRIYFAGDSGYGGHFQQVRERLSPIDLALLPIGAYLPRWFMQPIHMDPSDAVQAHLDLDPALSIGMHFGTIQLTDEGINEPESELQKSLKERGISANRFTTLGFGESSTI
jgi:L-ascorbate metabolism protein UlaG (beta-lactamase superfamily)